MSKRKATEIDGIFGSQLRDTQGETLSIEGADISELEAGRGRFNDNHSKGYSNTLGRVTYAKKIFKKEDCEDERQKYYWDKIKAPYIYGRGYLFDDEDHNNAKACAAILRNIHKTDAPLKIKFSVEGGVVARGVKDPTLLARTKIVACAITFTPANHATLAEPINLDKSSIDTAADMRLIKSVIHLAQTNVPSFRHVERHAGADKILDNINQIKQMAADLNIDISHLPFPSHDSLIKNAVEQKIATNIQSIRELIKAMMAGYGGAGAPSSMVGGTILQSQSLDSKTKKTEGSFKFITCDTCGKEQIHHKHQVKCRDCNKSFSLEKIYKLFE